MRLRFLAGASGIAPASWDALFPPEYPFTRHAFLHALEATGCVSPQEGWIPHHAVLEDGDGQALAAAPLYLKMHSYGEFVFDFAWANASHRLGRPYYPKWLLAIPFTPCTGPRVGARSPALREELVQRLAERYAEDRASSLHALFLDAGDAAVADAAGAIPRHDVQFHWHDRDYGDFAGFVARMSSEKRKKILRERRRSAESGIRFEHRRGDQLSENEWTQVYALYSNTYEERGQAPYLTLQFLLQYAGRPGTEFRLILAYEDARMVGAAITLQGGDTLYGRHWGAAAYYDGLHFETCYYQGIDYCLREGLRHFDAGAQGEHKLARGFEPVVTTSAHWLADRRLAAAVRRALDEERGYVAAAHREYLSRSPFRKNGDGSG
jgi:predicted N-acyltransferase